MKTILLLLISQALFAQTFNGSIQFSEAEKAQHLQGLPTLIQVTNQGMKDATKKHFDLIERCGMGNMFGFKSAYATMSASQRSQYLKKYSKCSGVPLREDVTVTSCELHTNKHLQSGFEAIGQAAVYKRIDQFLAANGRTGIALAYALTKLGWKAAYWNPDVTQRHPTPTNRRQMGATPEDHVASFNMAKAKGAYYGVPVSGWMVNFTPSPGSRTLKDTRALEAFKRAPYFIGVAHGGFHVFPGSEGVVIESHSPYNPDQKKNIEVGIFNPTQDSPQGLNIRTSTGGRKLVHYYSGIVVMPPGPWLWF